MGIEMISFKGLRWITQWIGKKFFLPTTCVSQGTLCRGVLLCMALLGGSAALAEPSVYPTGVTIYDPVRAHNTYVVFDGRDLKTHLIDMNGNEVRTWDFVGFPSGVIDPALTGGKRGHVLIHLEDAGTPPGLPPGQTFSKTRAVLFNNKTLAELDWDGNVVWKWGEKAPGGAAGQNHDWARLANGNTLVVSTLFHPAPPVLAGTDATDIQIRDQAIYEVTPSGDVVWKWIAGDHLEEFGFSEEGIKAIREKIDAIRRRGGFTGGYLLTINNMKPIGPNKWHKAGDQRFAPDNIVIDSREGNFIAIIDKKTGKIVWRIGPYYEGSGDAPTQIYSPKVPRPVDQIVGQHDAHIIPEGLPGAGNLLVFDNQGAAGYPPARLTSQLGSRVLEINPVKKEIVWQYTAENSDRNVWRFYSSFISSARRLPNGNTLIDEGMNGRIFQVTPKGDIVWEYVSPHFANVDLGGGTEVFSNWVYRAQPVPYDWVPEGTPRSENPIPAPDVTALRVSTKPSTTE